MPLGSTQWLETDPVNDDTRHPHVLAAYAAVTGAAEPPRPRRDVEKKPIEEGTRA